MKKHTEQTRTRFDHRWEIRRTYGLKGFMAAESELRARPVVDVGGTARRRSSTTWAVAAGAGVLLPGVTTLAWLVSQVREGTTRRLRGQPQSPAALTTALDVRQAIWRKAPRRGRLVSTHVPGPSNQPTWGQFRHLHNPSTEAVTAALA